jgi:hypothetical protein
MRTNETHQKAADSGERSSASNENGVATAAPNPLSRRAFFGRATASTGRRPRLSPLGIHSAVVSPNASLIL